MKFSFTAFIFSLVSMSTFSGCKKPATVIKEVNDKDISLQVMNISNDPGDKNMVTYKARIIPSKILLDEKSMNEKNALIYHMDSCFYIQSGIKRIYASLVQEVPNGVQGTYEYLLEFETAGTRNWDFVYQDKYLNQKKYKIGFN